MTLSGGILANMVRRTDTIWFRGEGRFIELMHALTHSDIPWSYPEEPSILLALDELIAWTNDTRQYDGRMHKAGWTSVGKDFLTAANALGTSVQQELRPHLDKIRALWHDDIGGDVKARAELADEAIALRHALTELATLKAAWQDLRRVSGKVESSIKTVSTRRDTFWVIVQAADKNRSELGRRLTGILSGDALATFHAKVELGEVHPDSVSSRSLFDAPLTPPSERLQLVEKLLELRPTSRNHIVWFAFKNAHLDKVGLDLEYLKIYWGEWLKGNLLSEGPCRPEVPAELHDIDVRLSIPDQQDVLLARVDLGRGTYSDAVRVAAERLDAVLEVSALGQASLWQWLPGYMHFQDGKLTSHRYFDYGDEVHEPRHLWGSTAAQITYMAPRIAPMIPIQDQEMKDIVGALHWWRVGLDHPTAAAVILNVRVIELVASRVDETSWTTYLEKYFKNWWIRHTIENITYFALYEALYGRVQPDVEKRQRDILLEVSTRDHDQRGMDVSRAATYLNEIIDFYPANLPLARDLRSIRKRTSNADAIEAWCAELERSWNGQVHRLERIRNSIGHGGPFTESGVLLAQPFSQQLSVHALREAIEGFLHGKTLTETHFHLAHRWDQWRLSLRTATSVVDVLG